MYVVYILQCLGRTYVGMTNDFFRRWKHHNGYLSGGAKYTTKYKSSSHLWNPILIIDGFLTMKEAMQCEWKLKRKHGPRKRIQWTHTLLTTHSHWTKQSPKIIDQNLSIYIDPYYQSLFGSHPTRELYWK